MKVTWIGQAGLILEKNGTIVMVDPYRGCGHILGLRKEQLKCIQEKKKNEH